MEKEMASCPHLRQETCKQKRQQGQRPWMGVCLAGLGWHFEELMTGISPGEPLTGDTEFGDE